MEEFDRQLMMTAPVSLGLTVVGIVQILLPRMTLPWRVALTGMGLGLALVGSANLIEDDRFAYAAVAAGTIGLILAVMARRAAWDLGSSRRTGAVVSVLGAVILGVAVARYETALNAKLDADTEAMTLPGYIPERELDPELAAHTDRGRALTLWRPSTRWDAESLHERESRCMSIIHVSPKIVRTGGPTEDTNCHGWVFTGGRSNLTNAEVEMILADNGYVPTTRPLPGDLAIYRNGVGITHTAIVRAVEPGQPVIVESKWSWMGVYRHNVDESIYGVDYTYYRTPRASHLVKLQDRSTPIFSGAE